MENFGFIETTANITGSGTFNGSTHSATVAGVGATDTAYRLMYEYFNASFILNQVGTCKIQGSHDGTTWYDCASQANTVNVPLNLQVPVTYKNYRVQFVNGVTGTTSQSITSSFMA